MPPTLHGLLLHIVSGAEPSHGWLRVQGCAEHGNISRELGMDSAWLLSQGRTGARPRPFPSLSSIPPIRRTESCGPQRMGGPWIVHREGRAHLQGRWRRQRCSAHQVRRLKRDSSCASTGLSLIRPPEIRNHRAVMLSRRNRREATTRGTSADAMDSANKTRKKRNINTGIE